MHLFVEDDETEEILSNDFEVGQILRDQVVPKAVLFFTGDALDYSDVSLSWFSVYVFTLVTKFIIFIKAPVIIIIIIFLKINFTNSSKLESEALV